MQKPDTQPPTDSQSYRFSTNRGRARHRVRYVEGTAGDPQECRLCQEALTADEESPDAQS